MEQFEVRTREPGVERGGGVAEAYRLIKIEAWHLVKWRDRARGIDICCGVVDFGLRTLLVSLTSEMEPVKMFRKGMSGM